MADEIKNLLTAIQTALTPLKTAGTINHLEIADMGGEQGMEAQLRRVGGRPPFILIGYGGGGWKEVNRGSKLYERSPKLGVLIGVSSLMGRSDARDGLFDLEDAVRDALASQTLSLDIQPLVLGSTDPVVFGPGYTAYQITVTTRLRVTAGG